METSILPKLKGLLGAAMPRVLPSYALLFWFTVEVKLGYPMCYLSIILTYRPGMVLQSDSYLHYLFSFQCLFEGSRAGMALCGTK